MTTNPTARRLLLGARLKMLREGLGWTQGDAARHLECSISKITRMESGIVGVQPSDLVLLLAAYKVTDPEAVEELTGLARGGRERGWWAGFKPRNPMFVGLENAARSLRIWQPLVVPGLLQTRDYAYALLSGAPMQTEDLDRQVALRLRRQGRVHAGDLQLHAIIDESVLARQVGDRETMVTQLERLSEMSRKPNVVVQVRRWGAEVPVTKGPFALMVLEAGTVLHSEGVGGDALLNEPDAVQEISCWFGRMAEASATPGQTRDVIRAMIEHGARLADK